MESQGLRQGSAGDRAESWILVRAESWILGRAAEGSIYSGVQVANFQVANFQVMNFQVANFQVTNFQVTYFYGVEVQVESLSVLSPSYCKLYSGIC